MNGRFCGNKNRLNLPDNSPPVTSHIVFYHLDEVFLQHLLWCVTQKVILNTMKNATTATNGNEVFGKFNSITLLTMSFSTKTLAFTAHHAPKTVAAEKMILPNMTLNI